MKTFAELKAENMVKASGTSESVTKAWVTRHAGMFVNVTDPEHLLSKITEHDTAMSASRTPDEFAAHKLSRDAYSATDSGSNFQHKKAHLAAKAAHEKLQLFHAGKGEYGSEEPSKEAVSHREKAMAHREQALEHHAYAKVDRDQQLFEEKPEEYERRFPQASEHSTDNPFWMK
jgi:hypothetical protein